MKNLLQSLEGLNFPISKIAQQPINDKSGHVLAWNFYVQNEHGISLAGGTHTDIEIAKKIAIAESFERALARKISEDAVVSKYYLMDLYPTSCGFAAGFDKIPTRFRALKEAVERWAWSKWIDESFQMEEQSFIAHGLSPLSEHIFSGFSKVRIFRKDNIAVSNDIETFTYSFLVLLLETENGVFAGCRAGPKNEDLTLHAAVEAFRNYHNFTLSINNGSKTTNSIVAQRNNYFATHKTAAFDQIDKADKRSWPTAEVRILKEFPTNIEGVYLWRCLMKDFLGWHLGTEKRFVY